MHIPGTTGGAEALVEVEEEEEEEEEEDESFSVEGVVVVVVVELDEVCSYMRPSAERGRNFPLKYTLK
jgi:hypothetical protein